MAVYHVGVSGMDLMRWSHALAGAIALLSMSVPLLSKKGGRVHRRAGWVFVVAMTWTATSSGLMAIVWFASGDPKLATKATFFGFLALLSGESIFYGLRVLGQKQRVDKHRSLLDLGAAATLVLVSVVMLVVGLTGGNVLFGFFGGLGLLLGGGQLRTMLRAPKFRQFWWPQHLGAMGTACIAALTAFLVVNIQQFPFVPPLVAWIAPGSIGGALIAISSIRYERRFTRQRSPLT